MLCPKCKTISLTENNLERGLAALHCPVCQGNWLLLENYLNWKTEHSNDELVQHDESFNIEEIHDTKSALICPISGCLMTKFRISHKSEHRLDISTMNGGIWLDKGEWELLKKFNLAFKLNQIFTDSWQHKLRTEVTKEMLTKLHRDRFDTEDYDKLIKIKQ